ncbi:MAG TPA: PH domain-containing protein [Candidatus Saccharimonadia bacterium]|jgi:uncharacterized membrane protein YdbT with pleckstrin-like domain
MDQTPIPTPNQSPAQAQPPAPEQPGPTVGHSAETGELPEPGETPTPYGFDLDPGEQITRIIHRHPLTLLPTLFTSVLLILVALAFAFGEGRYPDTIPFPRLMVFALVVILLVLAALIFLIGLFVYQRNVLIFTNVHLLVAEQYGLFSHRISQVAFVRVQDVTGTRKGIARTIFNYGDVEIESAGAEEKFIFRGASDPQEIADEALEIHERFLHSQGLSEPTE